MLLALAVLTSLTILTLATVAVIGKNPARTDANNATLRRVRSKCERLQLHPFLVNLFALRGDPTELAAVARVDPAAAVGPYNDDELDSVLDADLVIAAWGQPSGVDKKTYDRRVRSVIELGGADRFVCFGMTSGGYPLHPVHWRRDARPTEYRAGW